MGGAIMMSRGIRGGIIVYFLVHGFIVTSWVAQLPAIQSAWHLTYGQLGTVLLLGNVAAVAATLFSGRLITHLGINATLTAMIPAACISLTLMALATTQFALLCALVVFSASMGAWDVAINTRVMQSEIENGDLVIARLHAMTNIGGAFGAGIAGLTMAMDYSLAGHFFIASATALLPCLWVLARSSAPAATVKRSHTAPCAPLISSKNPLWILGFIAFNGFLIETTLVDWSTVYFADNFVLSNPGSAVIALFVFTLTMVPGRLFIDVMARRISTVYLLRGSGLLTLLGSALIALGDQPGMVIAGFAVVGMSISVVTPLMIRAAGHHSSLPLQQAIARITSMSYLGLLLGAPLFGWLTQTVGIRQAVGIIALAGLSIGLLSSHMPHHNFRAGEY